MSRGRVENTQLAVEGFPSGQRGQTVNLLALPSVVRIHPPPPTLSQGLQPLAKGWRRAGPDQNQAHSAGSTKSPGAISDARTPTWMSVVEQCRSNCRARPWRAAAGRPEGRNAGCISQSTPTRDGCKIFGPDTAV